MENTLISTAQEVPTSTEELTIWKRLSKLIDTVRAIFVERVADYLEYNAGVVYTYISDDRKKPALRKWGLDIDAKKTMKKNYKQAFIAASGLSENEWAKGNTYLKCSVFEGEYVYVLEDLSELLPLTDEKHEQI